MFRMEEFRVVFLDRVILLIPVERRMKNFHLAPRFFFSPLLFLSYTQARAFRSIVIEIRSTVYQDTIRATFN